MRELYGVVPNVSLPRASGSRFRDEWIHRSLAKFKFHGKEIIRQGNVNNEIITTSCPQERKKCAVDQRESDQLKQAKHQMNLRTCNMHQIHRSVVWHVDFELWYLLPDF